MENNKNKKSVKYQGDMLNFCDFIQVYVFTRNHHLKLQEYGQTAALQHFFQIYCHNAVPEVAKPRITQPISKKKTFTNNTSTSRFIIIYQIHDILGKYLENKARQNYGSAHFTFIH